MTTPKLTKRIDITQNKLHYLNFFIIVIELVDCIIATMKLSPTKNLNYGAERF